MEITRTLYVATPAAWRAWLKKHHATAKEIFLVYPKKHSGKPRISYNDAVDQALCFGWIDSITKTIDEDHWCQRYTPRRKGSALSEMNKARVHRMIREKQMTSAGLKALDGALRGGAHIHRGRIRESQAWVLPPDIEAALKKAPGAWKHFKSFPLAYRRIRVAHVVAARHRRELFRSRLANLVKQTALGKRFGMVQE